MKIKIGAASISIHDFPLYSTVPWIKDQLRGKVNFVDGGNKKPGFKLLKKKKIDKREFPILY